MTDELEQPPQDAPHKLFKKERFTHDPVAFGSLMDFQYGDSEVSHKESQRLLFEETRGVLCQDFDELGILIQNLDFWEGLGKEKEGEPKRYRFYANDRSPSLLGAKLLEIAGVDFELVRTEASTLPMGLGEPRVPLPILVDLEQGFPYEAIMGVRNLARRSVFKDWGDKTWQKYYPSTLYRDDGNYPTFPEVLCFGSRGETIFKGDINKAPIPLKSTFKWYASDKQDGKISFKHVFGWNLGKLSEIIKQSHDKEVFILNEAPAALFFDEIEAFRRGEEKIVLINHGDSFEIGFEAYFVKKGNLFRIYAR